MFLFAVELLCIPTLIGVYDLLCVYYCLALGGLIGLILLLVLIIVLTLFWCKAGLFREIYWLVRAALVPKVRLGCNVFTLSRVSNSTSYTWIGDFSLWLLIVKDWLRLNLWRHASKRFVVQISASVMGHSSWHVSQLLQLLAVILNMTLGLSKTCFHNC